MSPKRGKPAAQLAQLNARHRVHCINLHHFIHTFTQASGADFRQRRGPDSNAAAVRQSALNTPNSVKGIPQKLIFIAIKVDLLPNLLSIPSLRGCRFPQLRHHTQPRTITVTMLSEAITMHKP